MFPLITRHADILLDGHLTMRRKSDGGIEEIHIDVFRDINVRGIILFIDEPSKIAERMRARDGSLILVEVFHEHQNAEIRHAHHVAATLGLPLSILQAFDTNNMEAVVHNWKTSK